MKTCKRCEETKELTEYYSNGKTYKGTKKFKANCKPCEQIIKVEQMISIFDSIVDLECAICGYDKCFAAIDFHHLDPQEKDFGIRDIQLRNKDKLRKEIAKCAVLCVRCHREYHAGAIEVTEEHRAILK